MDIKNAEACQCGQKSIDWRAIARSAAGGLLIGGALAVAICGIEAEIDASQKKRGARTAVRGAAAPTSPPSATPLPFPHDWNELWAAFAEVAADAAHDASPPSDRSSSTARVADPDQRAVQAAEALGVRLDANADEIRAALRANLASSAIHPDQGGDGEEAKRLIAAKNLLIERAHNERREAV